jgi:hypothetical protein
MPNAGGSYEIRGGKRVLVHNTQPTPVKPVTAATKQPAAPVKTDAAPKPAKAAAKQEVDTDE